jgi:hypothetical protein
MRIVPYAAPDAAPWDEFVARAPMATFLHTRRFLAYHGARFQDCSLLIRDEREQLVGLLPAAVDRSDARRVVSHPGITFGGVLHAGALRGERMLEALQAVRAYYAEQGFATLRYKAVPYIYHRTPAADDLYALFRLDAARYRCDLSCAIDVAQRPEPSSRRKRGLKKALKSGVELTAGAEFIEPLWQVLSENLARKHGVQPVHSAAEISYLHSLFPQQIEFVVARLAGEVLAGVVLFVTPMVLHAQYIAASLTGYEVSALDAVFEDCVQRAQARGIRYFDFGVSTVDEGRQLNAALNQFKAEFGGGGVVHDFYELALR